MDLLTIIGDEQILNPHYLSVKVIADIWKRDHGVPVKNADNKSVRVKNIARREIAWIHFMENWASPYQSYIDLEKRERKVKAAIGLSEDWKEDKALKEAREWYAATQVETNPDIIGLNASRKAMSSIEEFLTTIDLNSARNRMPNGAAIYKPKDITSAIKELQIARKAIKEQEADVRRAQTTVKRIRGGGGAGLYED
jgi:hypothetical protein